MGERREQVEFGVDWGSRVQAQPGIRWVGLHTALWTTVHLRVVRSAMGSGTAQDSLLCNVMATVHVQMLDKPALLAVDQSPDGQHVPGQRLPCTMCRDYVVALCTQERATGVVRVVVCRRRCGDVTEPESPRGSSVRAILCDQVCFRRRSCPNGSSSKHPIPS
uniref:Uncharacterized protein n=1 Tax=Eutreptiella gymnastica TaxID=73025 RepID=A0A7S4FXC1_9EUGL